MKRICLLVVVALAGVLPAPSKDQPVATLTGMVTSDAEGHMGGVLVTARPEGVNMTVTVISDDQGHYAFPPGRLQPGKFALTIRAAGYELAGQTVAEIKTDKAAHVDIKLVKTKDLASQLTGHGFKTEMAKPVIAANAENQHDSRHGGQDTPSQQQNHFAQDGRQPQRDRRANSDRWRDELEQETSGTPGGKANAGI